VLSPDLADDRRWPELGARIAHETGLRSALSIQIVMEEEHAAGLNLYGNAVAAFDRHTVDVLPVFTAQAASALEAVAARQKAENLEKALLTSREIGMALGILMSSMKIRSEEAFDILRIASQARHRKLVDLARDVVETGMLDLGPS
jgi:AmiR/NasT family two-component response regulator